jgi:hypothetical protein
MNEINGSVGGVATRSASTRSEFRRYDACPRVIGVALFMCAAACSSSQPSGSASTGTTSGTGSGSVSTGGSGSVSSGNVAGSGSVSSGGSGSVSTGGSGSVSTGGSGSSGGSTTGTGADAAADAVSMMDATNDTTSDVAPPTEAGLGGSCVAALYSTYIVRTDGILIWENNAASPETIRDASTGNALTGILNVQEGPYHGCAALSGGRVECWQTNATSGNTSGQLGNGTTTATSTLYSATPVLTGAAAPLTNVVAVAPGDVESNNACAVTSDGKVWCWGDLTWLVQNGTTLHTGYAQAITTDGTTPLTGVSSVVLGSAQACAILSGQPNSLWCWGYNADAELGLSTTMNQQYPTKVLGLTSPTALAATHLGGVGDTLCALDGSNVRCWGENSGGGAGGGAAGTNTATNPVLSPTSVVSQSGTLLSDVAALQGGANAFAALLGDGTIWTWGGGEGYGAGNYGLTNVLAIGWAGLSGAGGPRYVTSDGVYHSAMTNVAVNCNAM